MNSDDGWQIIAPGAEGDPPRVFLREAYRPEDDRASLSIDCLPGEGRFAVNLDAHDLGADVRQVTIVYKPRWWPGMHSTWKLRKQPGSGRVTLQLVDGGADTFLATLLREPEELTLHGLPRSYHFQVQGFRSAATRLPCLKRLVEDPRAAWLWRNRPK